MSSVLFHIWGPITIHSYGFFIAIGFVIFIALIMSDARFKKLSLENSFFDIVSVGVFFGIMGGRVWYIVSEKELLNSPLAVVFFWEGGLSILGSIIAGLIGISLFLLYKKIPVLTFLDLVAIYMPLLQSIGRIGCFYAGCCYGLPCQYPWAIMYTDYNCYAPLNLAMHPTQLYSALLLFVLFLVLFFYVRHKKIYPGFIVYLYICSIALERCIVDFWRADRCMHNEFFSYNQYIALGLIILSGIGFACYNYNNLKRKSL